MARPHGPILIDSRLLAYRRGGIARYVAGLVDWLPRVAPDLVIQQVINRRTASSQITHLRVRTPPHYRYERVLFGTEMTARRPALLHSPDFIAPHGIGFRRVVTVHDLTFLRHPELLADDARRYYGQIERSLAVADRVIAVSDYTSRELRALTHVDPNKIVTIPNGIEPPGDTLSWDEAGGLVREGTDDKRAAAILEGRPIALVVGTIEPRKRQHLVLQALRYRSLPDSKRPLVVLVGQRGWACEPIVAEIERAVANGDAIWIDDASDTLLAALYQLATLLALPSLDEGFGLPLLEAMAAGLPVVASKRGALPEVAGNAALLVDRDEPEAWFDAMSALITDEAHRERLRRAGRSRAAHFSWERTATETAALYREVLAE